jgi:predicted RNA-binding protein (virulence factor B family)
MNDLVVCGKSPAGVLLDDGEGREILLPKVDCTGPCEHYERVTVFLYLDSEGDVKATMREPLGRVGRFSYLKVAQVNEVGAFLDWGLPKDVLAPYHEQKTPMVEGESYLVYIYLDDKTQRITASSKVDRFLKSLANNFSDGQAVEIVVESTTDLGFKCIVDQTHWGILYESDVHQPLTVGQRLDGFIKKVREDRKIDLCLRKPGYGAIDGVAGEIMAKLEAGGGFLAVTDKSPPEAISQMFGVSKKAFKKAIGALYKKRIIALEDDGIRLL